MLVGSGSVKEESKFMSGHMVQLRSLKLVLHRMS